MLHKYLEIVLPQHVKLRQNVVIRKKRTCLEFSVQNRSLSFESTPEMVKYVCRLLDKKSQRPIDWSEVQYKDEVVPLFESLLVHGFVEECSIDLKKGEISGDNFIGLLMDFIDKKSHYHLRKMKVMPDLLEGTLEKHIAYGWLIETFFFTVYANWHISPLLDLCRNELEYNFWKDFLKDESSHWKIYKLMFKELGVGLECVKRVAPLRGTHNFVKSLRQLSSKSIFSYASTLNFLEQPPQAEEIDEDKLCSSLINNYGFSRKAVLPFWRHSVNNGTHQHDILGSVVLNKCHKLSAEEKNTVFRDVDNVLNRIKLWYDDIYSTYSVLAKARRRFKKIGLSYEF